jgi:hypothetical protein
MPAFTPRGFEYPCYSDANDFPAQIQALATDIDGNVQAFVNNLDDARNDPPGARITGNGSQALTAGSPAFGNFDTEDYDNAGMYTSPANSLTVQYEGLYFVTARITFSASAGVKSAGITLNSFLRYVQTRQAINALAVVNVHGLLYAAVGDLIQVVAESTTATTLTNRILTATRMTGATLL